MIEFNGNYIAAEEVSYIEAADSTNPQYPYKLTVWLKSGKSLSVVYRDKGARDQKCGRLASQIERAMYAHNEKTENYLYRIETAVCRIDKRQLRLWKVLKQLLAIQDGDADGLA